MISTCLLILQYDIHMFAYTTIWYPHVCLYYNMIYTCLLKLHDIHMFALYHNMISTCLHILQYDIHMFAYTTIWYPHVCLYYNMISICLLKLQYGIHMFAYTAIWYPHVCLYYNMISTCLLILQYDIHMFAYTTIWYPHVCLYYNMISKLTHILQCHIHPTCLPVAYWVASLKFLSQLLHVSAGCSNQLSHPSMMSTPPGATENTQKYTPYLEFTLYFIQPDFFKDLNIKSFPLNGFRWSGGRKWLAGWTGTCSLRLSRILNCLTPNFRHQLYFYLFYQLTPTKLSHQRKA